MRLPRSYFAFTAIARPILRLSDWALMRECDSHQQTKIILVSGVTGPE